MEPWVMAFLACMPNALTGPECVEIEIGPFFSETQCMVAEPVVRRALAADLIAMGYGAAQLSEGLCHMPPPPGEPV